MALRPVNRIKHVVDGQFGITGGANFALNIASTTDTPTLAITDSVETGSVIKGFFLVMECYATTAGALSNVYMAIWKNPGGNLTAPAPNTVGGNDNKKYVIHQEMIMLQKQVDGNPRTLFKGVIVIPKHLQRNGPADDWRIQVLAPGVNIDLCYQVHYKEFR